MHIQPSKTYKFLHFEANRDDVSLSSQNVNFKLLPFKKNVKNQLVMIGDGAASIIYDWQTKRVHVKCSNVS